MPKTRFPSATRAVALCVGLLAAATGSQAAGDKAAYDSAKAAARSTFDAAVARCDGLAGHAKDLCIAEAKAARMRSDARAEAAYQDTPKAREQAADDLAEADYTVARERCNERAGNDKDVCIKVVKAALVHAKADAKARRITVGARIDADEEKREADYKVAAEKCDALAGAAKSACIAEAKAKFGR